MRKFLIPVAVGLTMLGGPAEAQRGPWTNIGSATFGAGWTHGTIRTSQRRVWQVRLCASGTMVNIDGFRVTFVRGGSQFIPIHRQLRSGQCSNGARLRSAPQSIRSATVDFVRLRQGMRPIVRIQGR